MITSTLAFILATVSAEIAVHEVYNTTGDIAGFYVEDETPMKLQQIAKKDLTISGNLHGKWELQKREKGFQIDFVL